MPDITLVTSDGSRLGFACPPDTNVLDAAAAAGLFLPAMCREGSCGLCHAHVGEGTYELGTYTPNALTDADDSGVLLCRCRPRSDLVIDLPYTQNGIQHHDVPTRDALIEALDLAGAGAVRMTLVFTPDSTLGQAADFVPGQYMEVAIPGTSIRRAYSLANLPNWEGHLEFLIRLQPNGAFSTYLGTTARVGDRLIVRGPLGNFVLDETSPRPRCLIGGGCGFAPVLSMLRHLADFQDTQPTHLIFGATQEDELFPAAEIAALREALPQLGVTLSVWRPGPAWTGFTGTAADALRAHLRVNGDSPDVYVCGPPKLLDAVTGVAREHGIPAEQIIAERVFQT